MAVTRKRRMWWELLINVLLLAFPVFLMIDGALGVAKSDPFHPDVFILMGILLMGFISTGMLLLALHRVRAIGWHQLQSYQRGLAIFYGIWFIIGLFVWLAFTEIIPPNWLNW